VLEREGLAISAVSGTVGVERHRVIFRGQTAPLGCDPDDMRRDTFLAAAATRWPSASRQSVTRAWNVGAARLRPGIVTAVAGETVSSWTSVTGRRCAGSNAEEAQRASEEAARAEGCAVSWEPVLPDAPTVLRGRAGGRGTRGVHRAHRAGAGTAVLGAARRDPLAGAVRRRCCSRRRQGDLPRPEEDTPEAHLRSAWRRSTGPSAA